MNRFGFLDWKLMFIRHVLSLLEVSAADDEDDGDEDDSDDDDDDVSD